MTSTPQPPRRDDAVDAELAFHVEMQTRRYVEAGFDEIYVANMGPHYRDFFQLYANEVLPRVRA